MAQRRHAMAWGGNGEDRSRAPPTVRKRKSDTSAVNFIPLTRGGVDASPEHLRPRFDGGTGVRTVRATQTYWAGCIPTFGRNCISAVWSGIQSENLRFNRWTG